MMRKGRPPAIPVAERKELVFKAAERLFASNGYEKVRMIDIAESSGMAKKTLYVLFKDKEALLTELIGSSYVWSEVDFGSERPDPVEELHARLRAVIAHVLSPRHVTLCRLAISESLAINGIAETFQELGFVRSRRSLIATIEKIPPRRMRCDLPADILSGMLYGATCAHRLMGALLTGQAPDLHAANRDAELVMARLFKAPE